MAKLRHLILIMPGIGGSHLRNGGGIVWDGSVQRAIACLRRPEALHLSADDGVEACGMISSVCITPFWVPIPGYERLVRQLVARFDPKPAVDWGVPERADPLADIVACPYDFRRSVADAALNLGKEVRGRLEARRAAGKPARTIVVAHSLGGLVARYWLATDKEAASSCEAVITLGTPHRGSPKALEILVNGLHLARHDWPRATAVLRNWPSLHELLPRYPSVLDQTVEPGGVPRRPYELALPGVEQELAAQATRLHKVIDQGWVVGGAAAGVQLVPFVGVGQTTRQGARWDGSRLSVDSFTPEWLGEDAHTGDGAVPEKAAVPAELGERGEIWRPLLCRHGWFIDLDDVGQLVRVITDPGTSAYLGPPAAAARQLGLDVPDFLVAGTAAEVTVTLRTPDGGLAEHRSREPVVGVRKAEPGTAWTFLQCRPAESGWVAVVPLLGPGVYEVQATAAGWLPDGLPPVRELVTVIPAEAVEE